jgi:hypothetical protein
VQLLLNKDGTYSVDGIFLLPFLSNESGTSGAVTTGCQYRYRTYRNSVLDPDPQGSQFIRLRAGI